MSTSDKSEAITNLWNKINAEFLTGDKAQYLYLTAEDRTKILHRIEELLVETLTLREIKELCAEMLDREIFIMIQDGLKNAVVKQMQQGEQDNIPTTYPPQEN